MEVEGKFSLLLLLKLIAPGNRGFHLPKIKWKQIPNVNNVKKGGIPLAKDAKKQECFKMIAEGVSQKDIAKKLGVSEVTISRWMNPPKEKKEIEEANLWEKLRAAAADALDTMIYLSTKAKNENIRYAAAKDILDRIGLKPDESLKVSVEPVVIVDDLKE